jgi:PHP domain-containing protein
MNGSDPNNIVITGHVTAVDKAAGDYAYVPFDLPADIERIDVNYDYSRTSFAKSRGGDENVLDIGIFAPGSGTNEPGLFRGWSGGARAEFFVARDSATPGYIPGPMPAGRWQIILGLYHVASEGCDYTVTIELSSGRTSLERREVPVRSEADEPEPAETEAGDGSLTWYVGDLQSHTHHSDAKATVEQIAHVAASRGLDFLAVTDHNTMSHLPDLAENSSETLLLIPSMEITTYYGHANVWGIREWLDFRCRTGDDIRPRIQEAHDQRALISINHPVSDCPWTFGWLEGFDAIEVWQAVWNRGSNAALAWWDELLSAGNRIVGVGGSDRHEPAGYDPHFPHQVGTPTTRVRAGGLTTRLILDGIQGGRVVMAATPDGPWPDLTVTRADGTAATIGDELIVVPGEELTVECSVPGTNDDTVELVSAGGIIARRTCRGGIERFTVCIGGEVNTYIRAQIIAGPEHSSRESEIYPKVLALTNPVYLSQPGQDREVSAHGGE